MLLVVNIFIVYFQDDVNRAVDAAKVAFARGSQWRNLDASARGKLLNKVRIITNLNVDN